MKIKMTSVTMGVLVLLIGCGYPFDFPEAMITVEVVDEAGLPIADATVSVVFIKPKTENLGSDSFLIKGQSDAKGLFSASMRAQQQVTCGVRKDGYYGSSGKPATFSNYKDDKWQPWNPTVHVVLKKIGKPVPMYACSLEKEIPLLNEEVGLDLIERDWVAPHGSGKSPDIILLCTKNIASIRDFNLEMHLRFNAKNDGLIQIPYDTSHGSLLRLPREAPIDGYVNNLAKKVTAKTDAPVVSDFLDNKCAYFFRTRSGREGGPLYGKVINDFGYILMNTKTVKITFSYYLNPDGTRNMEFDPKRNLFKNLKSYDELRDP